MYNWFLIDLMKQWLVRRTFGRVIVSVISALFLCSLLTMFIMASSHPVAVVLGGLVQLILLPTVAVLTYHTLIMRVGLGLDDGETHCRKCRYVLRGISLPRCPECGEQI